MPFFVLQEDVVKNLLKGSGAKKLVNSKDKNEWSPLHCAAARGHLNVCKILINAGADVTAKNLDGATALHYLARMGASDNGKLFSEVLKLMLKKGAMVNEVNGHAETPLHQAAMKGSVLAVDVLLQNKADPNMQNEFGETALHYAVRLGNVKCVELLLAAHADVFLESEREEGSALTLAEGTGQTEILALLKSSSSYLDHMKKYGKEKTILRSMSSKNNNNNAITANAATAAPVIAPQPVALTTSTTTTQPPPPSGGGGGSEPSNVAFGVQRGKCTAQDCDCHEYQAAGPTGGPCQNCGHYPAVHRKIGKAPPGADRMTMSDPSPAPHVVLEKSAPGQDEVKRLDTLLKSLGPADLQHSWSINSSELKLETLLGEGTSAKVFKGKYRGQEVAVKVLKESPDPVMMQDFAKEFQIYSDVRSPHVVLFFGACSMKSELCMVFEFCSKGSLFDVLNSDEEIDWARVLKVSVDIAKALNTLHSWVPPIVHRDMKSLNLLVDSNWTVKVSDFGLSRFTSGAASNLSTLGKLRGTYAYSAPEVYFGEPFTTRADVYSVGVIFWELAVRSLTKEYCLPYSEYPELVFDFQIIIQVAKNSKRPTIPQQCPQDYKELIQACWAQNKDLRPEIPEVLAKLDAMLAKHSKK